jgi:hypothetical protein
LETIAFTGAAEISYLMTTWIPAPCHRPVPIDVMAFAERRAGGERGVHAASTHECLGVGTLKRRERRAPQRSGSPTLCFTDSPFRASSERIKEK